MWFGAFLFFQIIFSAGYIIVSTKCVSYQVFAMLIEVNTSFLHTRKLMQMAAVPRVHPIVQLNVYVNLITFVIFRFIPLGVLFYGMIYDGHRVPSWFLIQYSVCVAVLFLINFILLYRLLKADVFRSVEFKFFYYFGKKPTMSAIVGGESLTKKLFLRTHRKIYSNGGFCASLNIVADEYPPNSSNSHSRNASGVGVIQVSSSANSSVNSIVKCKNDQTLRTRNNIKTILGESSWGERSFLMWIIYFFIIFPKRLLNAKKLIFSCEIQLFFSLPQFLSLIF